MQQLLILGITILAGATGAYLFSYLVFALFANDNSMIKTLVIACAFLLSKLLIYDPLMNKYALTSMLTRINTKALLQAIPGTIVFWFIATMFLWAIKPSTDDSAVFTLIDTFGLHFSVGLACVILLALYKRARRS